MSDTVAIGLNVELELLVFAHLALFGVFQIDAGVFYGSFCIAADNFYADAIRLRFGSRRRIARRRILCASGGRKESAQQDET